MDWGGSALASRVETTWTTPSHHSSGPERRKGARRRKSKDASRDWRNWTAKEAKCCQMASR